MRVSCLKQQQQQQQSLTIQSGAIDANRVANCSKPSAFFSTGCRRPRDGPGRLSRSPPSFINATGWSWLAHGGKVGDPPRRQGDSGELLQTSTPQRGTSPLPGLEHFQRSIHPIRYHHLCHNLRRPELTPAFSDTAPSGDWFRITQQVPVNPDDILPAALSDVAASWTLYLPLPSTCQENVVNNPMLIIRRWPMKNHRRLARQMTCR